MLSSIPDWTRAPSPLPCTDCRSAHTRWVRESSRSRRILREAAPRVGRVLRADGGIDGYGGRAAECTACGAVAAYPTEADPAPRRSMLGALALDGIGLCP